MSFQHFLRPITMDRAAKQCVRTSLKLVNSTMAITGIAVLMYSVWMVVVCLRDYHKYHLPWFLWASIGVGLALCFTACLGHAAAHTRHGFLLSLYVFVVFLLLLGEILVIADVFLNDHWDKDFPKDPTNRFHDFVHFVDDNDEIFTFLAFLMLFAQGAALVLAMLLRSMRHNDRSILEHHDDLHIPIAPPTAIGYPQVAPDSLDANLLYKEYAPYPEKGIWSMAGYGGPTPPQQHP